MNKMNLCTQFIASYTNGVNVQSLENAILKVSGFYEMPEPIPGVTGIDVPVLITHEDDALSSDGVVVVLGQDPLRNPKDKYLGEKFPNYCNGTYVGTPYAVSTLQLKAMGVIDRLPYNSGTSIYYKLIAAIMNKNKDTYLTDVKKCYPNSGISQNDVDILVDEFSDLISKYNGKVSVILSGSKAQEVWNDVQKKLPVNQIVSLSVPHISGQGAMQNWHILLNGEMASHINKINYILELLFPGVYN